MRMKPLIFLVRVKLFKFSISEFSKRYFKDERASISSSEIY